MTAGASSLDALRQEIDRIDGAMHELLMQRTAVVEEIGRAKGRDGAAANGAGFFRPGREAMILRRLVAHHRGSFPVESLVRIWREIITGQLRVQTEIGVAVLASDGRRQYWDTARDHFGVAAQYVPVQRAHQVVSAVRGGSAVIGVLPLPQDEDGEPWWPLLASDDRRAPRIVCRLPFLAAPGGSAPGALVIALGEPEEAGEDRALLAVESSGDLSSNAMTADLAGVGFTARPAAGRAARTPAGILHLFETAGIVGRDDPRLDELIRRTRQPITRVLPLGGYAEPLGSEALSPRSGV